MDGLAEGAAPLYLWRFADCEFDEAGQRLSARGAPIAMEPRPLQVLAELLRHAGEVVTKDELLQSVWQGRDTVEHVLSTAVGKLRKALGEDLIQTVPRIGYRFAGSAERIVQGRRFSTVLGLQAGQAVPQREHFRLQQPLGRTQGSEVWLARHAKTQELRVYKFALDAERLSALKREVTLARLLRESLGEVEVFVRVIDWNFSSEPFFLESAYAGSNLLEWSAQEPDLALWDADQRVVFFLPVVAALAGAHSVGVLHKDLKPANLLVQRERGQDWRLRLTDFGSARLLQPERLAALGITALGLTRPQQELEATALYLAPELHGGGTPSVQSDVYALGVLLYQIVAADLRRPMAPGWEHDIDDELLREDIARATDGDPQRRLASAAALAERLRQLPQRRSQRWQQEQAAREAQAARIALERARTRRPWLIASLVLLLLGLGASLALYHRADAARVAAEQATARAEAIKTFVLDDILAAANPERSGVAEHRSVADLLQQAEAGMATRFAAQPLLRGSLREALGRSYAALARSADAVRCFELAREDYAADPAGTVPALRMRYAMASMLAQMSEHPRAREMMQSVEADAAPYLARDKDLALNAALSRAALHSHQFQAEPMRLAYAEADLLQRELYPEDVRLAYVIRLQLAEANLRKGDTATAERLVRALLDDPQLKDGRVSQLQIAELRMLHARVLRRGPRLQEALAEAQLALPVLETTLGADHPTTLLALSARSSIHNLLRNCAAALADSGEVVQRMRRVDGEHSQRTYVEIGNLGFAQYECGEVEKGLQHLAIADRELRARYGEANAAARAFRFGIAEALVLAGRHAEALQRIDALALEESPQAQAMPGSSGELERLRGLALVGLGKREEGLELLRTTRDRLRADGSDAATLQKLETYLGQQVAP